MNTAPSSMSTLSLVGIFLCCAFLCQIVCSSVFGQSAAKPELVVQAGHVFQVFSVAYSPDGRTIASASEDGTVKLWDAATLTELRSIPVLRSYRTGVDSVAFSPDGKTIATGTVDGAIVLWDVVTGAKLTEFDAYARSVTFSPDGKKLASASSGRVDVWDIASGGKLLTLPHDGIVKSVCFSSDGKVLISGGESGSISIWNVNTGALIRRLSGHDGEVQSVAISADGERIASAGMNGDLILWNAATGARIKIITGTAFEAVAFSPDSRTLAAGDYDGSIRILDAPTGNEERSITVRKKAVWSLVFSPDGTKLLTGSADTSLTQWEVTSGREVNRTSRKAEAINLNAIAPDGQRIAFSSWTNSTLKIWGVTGGIISLSPQKETARHIAFSPDGRMLAADDGENVKLWDADRATVLRSFAIKCGALKFAPDGRSLAIVNDDSPHIVNIFDVETGKLLRSWATDSVWVRAIVFSADGRLVVTGDDDGIVKLWDATAGTELQKVYGIAGSTSVSEVAFSSDGKMFAASYRGWVGVWSSSSGEKVEEFKQDEAVVLAKVYPRFPTLFSAIAPNGNFSVEQRYTGVVDLLDTHTKQVLARLVSLDNDWLVTTPDGYFDGTPNAWKQMIWRFNNNTFDYGAVELYFNDYFYPNLLQDVLAGNVPKTKAGNELEKKDRRQPQIKIASINGKPSGSQPTSERIASVEVEVTDNAGEKKQAGWAASSGAQDLRLFRNGSLVKVWHNDVFGDASGCEQLNIKANEPRRARCTVRVTLTAGDNELNAYAFNTSNVKSSDDTVTVKAADTPKRSGTLYVLAIGVNQYADTSYDLRYAVADVDEIAKTVKQQQDKLTGDAKARQYDRTAIVSLTDADATRENILLALNRFDEGGKAPIPTTLSEKAKAELAKISAANPEDAIIIYYAGHGTARDERFYLLPHNYDGKPEVTGVSDIDLDQYLENVDSGKLMMIIDACQSGAALGGKDAGRAPMNSKGLAQLAYDKGMLILTAAQSQQAALEAVTINGKTVEHGLLTYALLQAFGSADADKNADGNLSDREWLDYATKQVPELQRTAMKERSDANRGLSQGKRGAEIVYVNGDKNADPSKRNVQTPRVFYRREADRKGLVLSLR